MNWSIWLGGWGMGLEKAGMALIGDFRRHTERVRKFMAKRFER